YAFRLAGVARAGLVALGLTHQPPSRGHMRASQLLLPTVKEDPAGAEAISHKQMVRAGLVRQLAAGI
ncbi:MAG: hypothetical protein Q8K85_17295, partial [Hyphomicrobium sp.]|nr:hypothetical protein [Hyphomicrobium sp.]